MCCIVPTLLRTSTAVKVSSLEDFLLSSSSDGFLFSSYGVTYPSARKHLVILIPDYTEGSNSSSVTVYFAFSSPL